MTTPDMRPFPMQDGPPIPWFVAQAIYDHLYRYRSQTLERLAERGGFGWAEVEYMWRDPKSYTTQARRDACSRAVRDGFAALSESRASEDRP